MYWVFSIYLTVLVSRSGIIPPTSKTEISLVYPVFSSGCNESVEN